ncbi:MAG: hypothetical protein IJS39_11975 [Synergistaceae bacterium]|nr:hypothetical protein [Synergistaceae bacterium]
MSGVHRFSLFVIPLLLLSFSISSAHAQTYYYATTDMTFAEFYAGEIGDTSENLAVSYDAVSTATQRFITRFSGHIATTSGDGSVFTGVKAVQVRMTQDVYNSLSKDTRYTWSTDVFTEYKDAASDGTFGKMQTEIVTAEGVTVSFAGGASNTHGNYRLNISGLSYDKLGADLGTSNDNFLGAKLTASDGTVYGLKPLHNLWIRGNLAEQIGFCVQDFTERNGTHLSYAHTADISGKTITAITYMLKNQPDIVIECEVFVKKWTDAKITVSGDVKSGSNVTVLFTSSDIPSDSAYTLASVAKVAGRSSTALTSTDYTYSDGVLTFTNIEAGNYTAAFSDGSSSPYADITASITVNDYYAVTDMSWAEFYAGETGESSADLYAAGLDAVTTPTWSKFKRFPLLWGAVSPDVEGTVISGEKAVQVRMTGAVYEALTDKSRYTFSDDVFTEYKLVSPDGTFGAMVTETTTAASAEVVFTSGASSRWGHYTLTVKSADIDIGLSGDKIARNYLGLTLETANGKIYGMRHNNNIYSDADTIAFCISNDYVEPHGTGVERSYKYTAGLEGETITKITYMLKDLPDVVVSCNVFVVPMSITASANTDSVALTAGSGASLDITFSGVDGVTCDIVSLTLGSGKNAKTISTEYYSYSDGVLYLSDQLAAGTYTAVFRNEKYADVSVSFTVTGVYHFAATNMTYKEFYLGEAGELAAMSLDAVSSATTGKAARFGVLSYDIVSDDDGNSITKIYGLADVHVRMTDEVYALLSNDSRYTFSTTPFSEYKDVSSDNTFGKMVTDLEEVTGATVEIASGASTVWGNYWLKLSGVDSVDVSGKYLGAVLETSDGKQYPMQHLYNLFFKKDEMAFCVEEFTEPHGNTPAYAHTNDLAGKTITKITYMLKDAPDMYVSCDVYVPEMSTATVSLSSDSVTAGSNVSIPFVFAGLPDGVTYSVISLYSGSGRSRTYITDYTYANNTLTISGDISTGNYTAVFGADGYTDIALTFYAEGCHYAVTDMTWEEFYAGEIVNTSADLLDAVSSPTARVANRFTQLVSVSNDEGGRDITGVKDVQVRMSEEVYQLLSSDSRYTFSSTEFDEYKEVDSGGSFGAMVTETETASSAYVTLSSGASAVWGNYVLRISSADVTLGSGDTRYYLGALITTSDGKVYGMRHNNNLWFSASDMALAVQEFVEVHGVSRKYAYTSDMAGKTITKIQYMLKNQPDVVVNCSVTLPQIASAAVSLSDDEVISGTNVAIPLKFSGSPEGAEYSVVSVYSGSGRSRTYITDYSYSDNTLTISGDLAVGNYTAIFRTEGYTDIALTFRVEGYHYATTDMTWAEFYAGEIGTSSADLWDAGLDAVSSSTKRIAGRFTQLVSADNNSLGGADITGVRAVQVRMYEDVYQLLSSDSRYTFTSEVFSEYKEVNSDGSFGEMFTEYEDAEDAVVTLRSGANSTWGNYMLVISSADIALTSGDERLDMGALITASDGSVYGLRHNSNLWFSAGEIALTYEEFAEPHGISRDYDYTSDLQGKTITKIQYMLKNKPDVVISCDVYLKLKSAASVSYAYPDGYNAILAGTGDPITITFSNLSSDVVYDIASVTPSIRHASALDSSLYAYSDGKLSFDASVGTGRYKAVFSTEKYSDLAATVELFTTDATSLIVSDDNNGAGLNFLLTPKGYIDAVDEELDANKFVNASDYTHIPGNKTASYSAGSRTVSGSGFSFDVVLNGVSSDYTGIVGFGKQFTMTRSALGSVYNSVYTAVNSIPVGASGFREIPKLSALNSAGLKAVQVLPDGTSRDISALTGAGAMINSDGSIFLFYGVMAADSSTLTEGEYTLSPEGETLINDGARDGHIRVAIYLEMPAASSGSEGTPRPISWDVPPVSGDVSPDVRPASGDVRPPASGDVNPPVPPESGDMPVNPPVPAQSGDMPVNPPVPAQSGDIPVNPPAPAESGDMPVNPPTPSESGDMPVNPPTPSTSGDSRPSTPDTSGGTLPAAPAVDIQDTAIAQRIVDALSAIVSFITGDTEIAELPEESVGSERTIADVSAEELAAIPEGETPAVILPIMRVEKPAVYVFGVDLSGLDVGARIFLHMMAESVTTQAAAFYSSAEETEDVYTFLDDDGNETKVVPANKHVNAAAYMEPNYTYAPMITTASSSSEGDNSGGNTGGNSGGDNSGNNSGGNSGGNSGTDTITGTVGSSGGGCNTMGILAPMMLAVLLMVSRKR